MSEASAAHAAQFLRDFDRDRYFATLVLPAAERPAITALYAFAADVAAVRDRTREPAAGEIRLQWWVDALTGEGHGAVRQNPLADALLDAIEKYGLPIPALARLLAARRFDLYQDPMTDVAAFEGYAGETQSVLYQLAAMILGGGTPLADGDAAGHLGVAHALIGHLNGFGRDASQGRIFLPWSVFAAHGVAEGDILAGKPNEALTAALTQIGEMAGDHLAKARSAIAALPPELRPAFAPLALLSAQHKRLAAAAPFVPPAGIADWRKIAMLALWRLRA